MQSSTIRHGKCCCGQVETTSRALYPSHRAPEFAYSRYTFVLATRIYHSFTCSLLIQQLGGSYFLKPKNNKDIFWSFMVFGILRVERKYKVQISCLLNEFKLLLHNKHKIADLTKGSFAHLISKYVKTIIKLHASEAARHFV